MKEKLFHREEYPLEILAEFGLTEEMIYDLPDFVHDTLERGGKSPLLPISINQPFGKTYAQARFKLIDTNHGIDVLFSPKLKSIDLGFFTAIEKKQLLDGKVIITDIEDRNPNNNEEEPVLRIKSFVQIDAETNSVVYVPTQVIGRNLHSISKEFYLEGTEIEPLLRGELLTVESIGDFEGCHSVTIGVDLFSENGVFVVTGTKDDWNRIMRQSMPEYSFGNDGCWVNRNGCLQYVPEEEFTDDILSELENRVKQAAIPVNAIHHEQQEAQAISSTKNESQQITR